MPVVHIADPESNCREILSLAKEAEREGASLTTFPELSISAYTCADLFGQRSLLQRCEEAVCTLLKETQSLSTAIIAGSPVPYRGRLYNCALLIRKGKIEGIVPKTYLAGNGEFYEPRWFESARDLPCHCVSINYAGQSGIPFGTKQMFRIGGSLVAIEICQDLWSPVPPCSWAALAGAQVIVNLSASNDVLMKHEYRRSLVSSTSARLFAAYIYCSSGYGESTQDLVWAGSSVICENGSVLSESERFKRESRLILADVDYERLNSLREKEHSFNCYETDARVPEFEVRDCGEEAETDFEAKLLRHIDPHPFVPSGDPAALDTRCREIISAQILGLCTRLEHIRCKRVVIGVSGGLDSTLALIVAALAFDELQIPRSNIIGVTMPGFGTTDRTHNNSNALMELLGVDSREISIVPATRQHFKDIGQSEEKHDLTYENSQARERTQLLMDIAGKEGGIVVGTGDLSELALGWCTYNGDHMSMYAVNVSVPKTLVRTLVEWAADNRFASSSETAAVLKDIAATPISPELVPAASDGSIAQKTEDLVGPYELHDFFLYNFFRWGYSPLKLLFIARKAFKGQYEESEIRHWLEVFLKRFFTQQFKRSCIPDGPKVGSVSLSPRGDWRMPSDIESYWKL